MTRLVRSQLKELVKEHAIKREVKPRSVSSFACSVKTSEDIKAEIGEKVIKEKLYKQILKT